MLCSRPTARIFDDPVRDSVPEPLKFFALWANSGVGKRWGEAFAPPLSIATRIGARGGLHRSPVLRTGTHKLIGEHTTSSSFIRERYSRLTLLRNADSNHLFKTERPKNNRRLTDCIKNGVHPKLYPFDDTRKKEVPTIRL